MSVGLSERLIEPDIDAGPSGDDLASQLPVRRTSLRPHISKRTQTRLVLFGIVLLYMVITLTFSLMTRAGEGNDELDHLQYIEYVAAHGSFPHISPANGHESHQPPLYYLLVAGWQKVLGIPPFQLLLPGHNHPPGWTGLFLSHAYSQREHRDAIFVHELRVLSILLGLGTVLLTYVAGKLATGRRRVGLAAALFVAVLPKQAVVSSVLTNDALVILLSTLSLVLLLKWLRRDPTEYTKGHWLSVLLGLSLGAAALTKFNALPLAVVFAFVVLGIAAHRARSLRKAVLLDPIFTATGFFLVSGWWFLRNKDLYGQFLAQRASNAYLKPLLPRLVSPVSWFNGQRFLHFVPAALTSSAWYNGGWNQWVLPDWLNRSLAILAASCLVLVICSLLRRRRDQVISVPVAAALFGALVAGVGALVIVAQDTIQAEGRTTFVGLSAFAVLMMVGVMRIGQHRIGAKALTVLVWPVVLFSIDVYVFIQFVYPYRGL